MLLKSLLFALLSGTASVPPPLPRLRGTAQIPCPTIYRPVCCGGVTYANACVAGERQCDDGACSTPVRSGGYDEHEDQDEPEDWSDEEPRPSPSPVIELAARAAVSNHSTSVTKVPLSFPAASRAMNQNGSRFQ